MAELSEKDKRKIAKLTKLLEEGNLAIAEYLFEIEEKIDTQIPGLKEVIERMKGDKGDKPTEEELLVLIKPLIPPPTLPINGEDYVLTEEDKKEIAGQIEVPVVEKIIERTEVIKEIPIITEKVTQETTEVAVADTPEQLQEKLLSIEDAWIPMSAVKYLDDTIATLQNRTQLLVQMVSARGGSGGSGTPAGSNGEVQFNNNGSFGASPSLIWNNTFNILQIDGTLIATEGLQVGSNSPDHDPDINFEGENSTGSLVFMEDENRFDFSTSIKLPTNKFAIFGDNNDFSIGYNDGDDALVFSSNGSGDALILGADNSIRFLGSSFNFLDTGTLSFGNTDDVTMRWFDGGGSGEFRISTAESGEAIRIDSSDNSVILPNGALYAVGVGLIDSDGTNYLTLAATGDLTNDRSLHFNVGDANRIVTLSGNPTLSDWFDQSVKTTASPTFNTLTISNGGTAINFSTGAILNFASGNFTVTHSTNTLTFSGRPTFGAGILTSGTSSIRLGTSATEIKQNGTGILDFHATNRADFDSNVQVTGRVLETQGADVTAANDITLGQGNYFDITGTTQINRMLGTNWTAGALVTLQFDSTPTVKHNEAAGSSFFGFQLAGAADFVASAGDTLTLRFDGAWWREVARAVI